MTNRDKTGTEVTNMVQLVSGEDIEKQFGEAIASITKDQVVTWAKFILTDDKPNGNNQRIPIEEFPNLIKTGVHMPIKMALGEIKDGHEDAKPIGVITNLMQVGNKIMALAALWDHERDSDVAAIKERVNSGKPVNISWEILYGDSIVRDGISDLLDLALKAATIVGIPAYAGRTQFLAVAAKKWSPAYIEKLPDSSFLYVAGEKRYFAYRDDAGKIDPSRFQPIMEEIANAPLPQNTLKDLRHQVKKLDIMYNADASLSDILGNEGYDTTEDNLEIKELEGKVTELEGKLALANDTLVAKEKELLDAVALAEQTKLTVETLEKELAPLREFKEGVDKVAIEEAKLGTIKAKFTELGLEKEEKYFADNKETLLNMEEKNLDFMLQEMVAFKSTDGKETSASLKLPGVPVLSDKGDDANLSDPATLATELRNLKKKK